MPNPPNDPSTTETSSPYETIDHLLHPVAAEIRQLLDPAGRSTQPRFIIDDEENIAVALRGGVAVRSLFFSGDNALPLSLVELAGDTVTIYEVARRTCKKLFGKERASRLFAIAQVPEAPALGSLAEGRGDIIVLDHLTIQGNIGAIVRNAVAFDVAAIVLLGATPEAIYDRRLIRSSRGHVFTLPVVTATPAAFLGFASEHGLEVIATTGQADTALPELIERAGDRRLALVFGSERSGCTDEILRGATSLVQIPMSPRMESLNVSAACAIVMYQRYVSSHRDARQRAAQRG
ncbi:MAG TPA: RNA methyltransferase [Deltaproteobacteria bacterium]|nr:RNA methyltransferase [Deltaproteobacteria bacterium]